MTTIRMITSVSGTDILIRFKHPTISLIRIISVPHVLYRQNHTRNTGPSDLYLSTQTHTTKIQIQAHTETHTERNEEHHIMHMYNIEVQQPLKHTESSNHVAEMSEINTKSDCSTCEDYVNQALDSAAYMSWEKNANHNPPSPPICPFLLLPVAILLLSTTSQHWLTLMLVATATTLHPPSAMHCTQSAYVQARNRQTQTLSIPHCIFLFDWQMCFRWYESLSSHCSRALLSLFTFFSPQPVPLFQTMALSVSISALYIFLALPSQPLSLIKISSLAPLG